MHVIHIGQVPLPDNHRCGNYVAKNASNPSRWVINLAKAQQRFTDIQPEIVVKVPGGSHEWKTRIEDILCHFVPIPNVLRGKTGFFFDQRIIAKAVCRLSPDIVHAHGTEEANALAALRTPYPRLLTIQGCFFVLNRFAPPRFFSRPWIVERLERKTIPRFSCLITKSLHTRDLIANEFPGCSPLLVPNTYDPVLESIDAKSPRKIAIAFVGSISSLKGVHFLRDAIEKVLPQFPQLSLHICGDQPSIRAGYEFTIKNELKSLLGDRLHLHGIVPNCEAVKIVSQCRLLACPSLEESFGNQVVEALLVGTTVLTLEGTALSENVRKFGNGRVATKETLAEELANILSSPCDFDAASKARAAVMEWMSPLSVATKHKEIYEQLLFHHDKLKH